MDIECVNVKATLNYKVRNVCQQMQMRNYLAPDTKAPDYLAPDTKTPATT